MIVLHDVLFPLVHSIIQKLCRYSNYIMIIIEGVPQAIFSNWHISIAFPFLIQYLNSQNFLAAYRRPVFILIIKIINKLVIFINKSIINEIPIFSRAGAPCPGKRRINCVCPNREDCGRVTRFRTAAESAFSNNQPLLITTDTKHLRTLWES